jgi:hypothetical protein
MQATIKEHLYWPGMDKAVAKYVKICAVCQEFKITGDTRKTTNNTIIGVTLADMSVDSRQRVLKWKRAIPTDPTDPLLHLSHNQSRIAPETNPLNQNLITNG